jgi:cytochrome c553
MSIRLLRSLAVALALALASLSAHAGPSRFAADDPAWRAECGGCHTAFPPALLSPGAWRQVMGALDRHYGADASLDAATTASITAFLERNAGAAPRAAPAVAADAKSLPRLADAAWFAREHRKVGAATIARSDVRSLTNCAACHPAADRGEFSEHALRVPR